MLLAGLSISGRASVRPSFQLRLAVPLPPISLHMNQLYSQCHALFPTNNNQQPTSIITMAPTNNNNRRLVSSLEDFALSRSKADGKAIAAFRERKQVHQQRTAQQRRSYRKALAREGYKDVNNGKKGEYKAKKVHAESVTKQLPSAAVEQTTDKESAERERKQKLIERKQRRRILEQRTKKGQPIIRNFVHDILRKLEQEK